MWLQGRWAQDHPSPLLTGLSQASCISSIVPGWGHWLAIHKIEFITQCMMNFSPCSTANGPLFVPCIGCIPSHWRSVVVCWHVEHGGKQKPKKAPSLIDWTTGECQTSPSALQNMFSCRYKKIPPRWDGEWWRRRERNGWIEAESCGKLTCSTEIEFHKCSSFLTSANCSEPGTGTKREQRGGAESDI